MTNTIPAALVRPIAAANVLDIPLARLRRARWQRRGPRPIRLSRGIVRYAPSELYAYLAATAPTADPAIAARARDGSGPRRRHPPLARIAYTGGRAPSQGTDVIAVDRLIPIDEMARALAVSTDSIRRWCRQGRLRAVRVRRFTGDRRTGRATAHVSAYAIAELVRVVSDESHL